MNRKKMLSHLKSLGINNAIADENAGVNGKAAILLRWGGKEEYYTGFDIILPGDDPQGHPEYRQRLIETFGDANA